MEKTKYKRKPEWLKIKLPGGANYTKLKKLVQDNQLNTICSSGSCPNLGECWNMGTATFMILGEICTRSCKFCNVNSGKPGPIDHDEPKRIAESVKIMNLKHCVITSVDRDDLSDGGAGIWYETINEIKRLNPQITIEALIPDFNEKIKDISKVIQARPDILSHNLETVRRLTPLVRSKAKYDRSLKVIKTIVQAGITSKSGIMVGMGETFEEVLETMDDLLKSGCEIFTVGQYLQPTREHLPVQDYIKPLIFEEYKMIGLQKGFKFVESGPLVRSSYHAEKQMN